MLASATRQIHAHSLTSRIQTSRSENGAVKMYLLMTPTFKWVCVRVWGVWVGVPARKVTPRLWGLYRRRA
jgi:hypothetical protein